MEISYGLRNTFLNFRKGVTPMLHVASTRCVCLCERRWLLSRKVESHVIAEKVLVFQSLPVELWQLFPIDDLDVAKKLSLLDAEQFSGKRELYRACSK